MLKKFNKFNGIFNKLKKSIKKQLKERFKNDTVELAFTESYIKIY